MFTNSIYIKCALCRVLFEDLVMLNASVSKFVDIWNGRHVWSETIILYSAKDCFSIQ